MFIEYLGKNNSISTMNLDGSMYSRTPHNATSVNFDIDTVDNMLYYFDRSDHYIKRALIDNTKTERLYTHEGILVFDIAVDWIGRYIPSSLIS